MPFGRRFDPHLIEEPRGSGFREHLDLSGVIDNFEIFNPGSAKKNAEERETRATAWPRPGSGSGPERSGHGPIRCVTTKTVALARPQWAWDPNWYYRDLGIGWPYVNATRHTLGKAYVALDGQTSDRITYCFKQLLNIRAAYDALPLGERWLDDIYVQEEMRRQASREATRRTRAGVETTGKEVLDEWGYQVIEPEEETPEDGLDSDHLERFTEPAGPQSVGSNWHYAFYLWKTTDPDINRLAAWQAALVSEIDPEVSPTLVVGLMGGRPHEYAIAQVADEWVVFLNCEVEVSPDLARRAATALHQEIMRYATRANTNEAGTPKMALRKGGEAAREAAAAAQGARFARTQYLSIEDDGQEVVRYITDKDDWAFVDQHAGCPTKNKPADFEGTWPASMPAVCRYDPVFEGKYSDCYICDHEITNQWGKPVKATIRNWALACLREEVIGSPELVAAGACTEDQIGKRIGFKDATRMVAEVDEKGEPTGKEIEQRAIVVVNFAPSNFFNGLSATAGVYGTACDRDYVVKKSGKGKDVEYTHIALDKTPNLMPGTESWARYEIAVKEQNLDLEAIIKDRGSDDYYARFFDPTKEPAKKEGATSSANRPEVPAAAPEGVDEAKLAQMRERVRATSGAGASPAASEID